MGGWVIAQDKGTAEFFGMPEAAIHSGQVDFILPIKGIAAALIRLTASEKQEARDDNR
jgi:two-component system chemotaxis response regulator CheB